METLFLILPSDSTEKAQIILSLTMKNCLVILQAPIFLYLGGQFLLKASNWNCVLNVIKCSTILNLK